MNAVVDAPPQMELSPDGQKVYRPDGFILWDFCLDRSTFAIIQGPIGSGTSTACCHKIWQLACAQKPGPDGKRRTRWAVVRNTFPDLKNTTLKTWLYWFPEDMYGVLKRDRPFTHQMRVGDVECEVIFIALDDENDIKKLLSMELTGIFYNEGNFLDRAIVDEGLSRTGRYPPMAEGGPTWFGGFMDMNAPNEDHWVPMMFGAVPLPDDLTDDERSALVKPSGWNYFQQPPGLIEEFDGDGKTLSGYRINPAAENLKWLPEDYYLTQIQGKKRSWIDSRIMNRISLHVEGDAVFPQFRAEIHVSKEPLKYMPGYPLIVGLDFGRRPAALVLQRIGLRWIILAEYGMIDVGATTFAPALKLFLRSRFPEVPISEMQFWGDPKGQDKVQADEQTAYDVFLAHGMRVRPAPVPTNNIQTRLEAWEAPLGRMVDGKPGLLVSCSCRSTKVALAGGYHWRKNDRAEPVKNRYSDFMDGGGYGFLGGGEGRAVRGRDHVGKSAPVNLRPQKRRSLRRG